MDAPLPSIRRLVRPDPDFTLIDADYERADAQFVAWEADEPELKHIFQTGLDIYVDEARWLYGPNVSLDPRTQRQRLKSVCHAANYGGKERTLASTAGVTTAKMAEWLRRRWYGRFPGVPKWHKSVERRLRFERRITNVWGFRRIYMEDPDKVLPQALAWLGQSGVAVTINKAMLNVRAIPDIQLLLQVHDSLVAQTPTSLLSERIPRVKEAMRIIVPYTDPLIIPISIKTSNVSWGDMK